MRVITYISQAQPGDNWNGWTIKAVKPAGKLIRLTMVKGDNKASRTYEPNGTITVDRTKATIERLAAARKAAWEANPIYLDMNTLKITGQE